MQCALVHNSTNLKSRVHLADVTFVESIRKLNRSNKCCVMCAHPIAHTRNSQQKFSNVRLALGTCSVFCRLGIRADVQLTYKKSACAGIMTWYMLANYCHVV